VLVTTFIAWALDLNETAGVRVVGEVPQGLPPLTMPSFSPDLLGQLIGPAVLISIIGFVESVSVAQTLAAKKRQRIVPDQELIGLGAANVGAAFTGGYPVTGGFARSVVNFDAGAETPAAGAYHRGRTAARSHAADPADLQPAAGNAGRHHHRRGAVAGRLLDPEEDLGLFARRFCRRQRHYLLTLLFGVEVGVTAGVALSILIHLYKSSRPHMAVVGRVPGTEHFRNVKRHKVEIDETVLTLGSTRASISPMRATWKTACTTWWPPVRSSGTWC
jgi:SulP family sulfate permease